MFRGIIVALCLSQRRITRLIVVQLCWGQFMFRRIFRRVTHYIGRTICVSITSSLGCLLMGIVKRNVQSETYRSGVVSTLCTIGLLRGALRVLFYGFKTTNIRVGFLINLSFSICSHVTIFGVVGITTRVIIFRRFFGLFSNGTSRGTRYHIKGSRLYRCSQRISTFSTMVSFFTIHAICIINSRDFRLRRVIRDQVRDGNMGRWTIASFAAIFSLDYSSSRLSRAVRTTTANRGSATRAFPGFI